VVLQRRHVLGQLTGREQAGVHLGVQGLDAAVEHFRKARHLGHLGHRQAFGGQQLGRATGGNQPYAQRMQSLGEIHDAALVRNGNQLVHHCLSSKLQIKYGSNAFLASASS